MALKTCLSASRYVMSKIPATATPLKTWCMIGVTLMLLIVLCPAAWAESDDATFRPPAVPLVTCDPYFSIWSNTDTLSGGVTRHWTGRPHPLTSLVRIDGKTYRLMGEDPKDLPALPQTSLEVLPTQTIYTFQGQGVRLTMTFLQPALPENLDWISSPVVFLTWDSTSTDQKSHDVAIYLDAAMDIVVNSRDQNVVWAREKAGDLDVLQAGSQSQYILGRSGDNVRIDWGYFYLATSESQKPRMTIAAADACRKQFISDKPLPAMDVEMPKAVDNGAPVMAIQWDLKTVQPDVHQSCRTIFAYDDIQSVLYFGKPLSAYWKRDGKTIEQLLVESDKSYTKMAESCQKFDEELMADLEKAGGVDYRLLGSLAYRQALAANKIVADEKGMPLMFSKENFSNGCMGTVDVFYPFAPQVLLLSPALAKASFVPILEYGRSERWKFPFAPHDIGRYPHALGQVYGGGEHNEQNQMPVEESGNMILLVAAVVQAENDIAFAKEYWDLLTTWAEYLKSKGLDPEEQLCTDDFTGHLAHNVNLSLKAIVALAAYAQMAEQMGEPETAKTYRETAEQYVKDWMRMADNGDHYRLAFNRPDTWSQKYNLIWDRLLGLNLFPTSVAEKEMAYYKKVQNRYGLPLDNRSQFTKLDWIVWTASLTGKKEDFEALVAPVVAFLNATPDRVPMTDWYFTDSARKRGFQARPVVGGVFIRLMDDKAVWRKWASRADSVSGTWSPLPKQAPVKKLISQWDYTFTKPADNWFQTDFDAIKHGWKKGKGGFGTSNTPGIEVSTKWDTPEIWIRGEWELEEVPQEMTLMIFHDEDAIIYINGKLVTELSGYTTSYAPYFLSKEKLGYLKKGKNTIAIHCRQTTGGQGVDVKFSF